MEDKEECCLTIMVGNRSITIAKLAKVLRCNTCCRKCAVKKHKAYISEFLAFCKAHEEQLEMEEHLEFFMSRTQRLEWRVKRTKSTGDFHVSEETWGVATAVFGCCWRPRTSHRFAVEASQIFRTREEWSSWELQDCTV